MDANEKRGAEYLGAEWDENRAAWVYRTVGDEISREALPAEVQDLGRRLGNAYGTWCDTHPERCVR